MFSEYFLRAPFDYFQTLLLLLLCLRGLDKNIYVPTVVQQEGT